MNFLKSYIKRSNIYYKSYYYRNSFTPFNFYERYEKIKQQPYYKTETPILFKGKVPFATNIKEIQQLLGKAHYIHHEENLRGYITVYYKNKLSSIKNKSQLHLYNNQFFYGIQLFPYLNKVQIQEFYELLRIKYQFPSNIEFPITICDSNQNLLVVSNNVGLILEYISGDNLLVTSVIQEFNHVLNELSALEQKRRQLLIESL
ncbi:MAG: hypothetical protein N2449_02780 [Bacteroidales bacterium]|nr:hypothetical protein [Bacteroidales bacterium]